MQPHIVVHEPESAQSPEYERERNRRAMRRVEDYKRTKFIVPQPDKSPEVLFKDRVSEAMNTPDAKLRSHRDRRRAKTRIAAKSRRTNRRKK